MNQHLPPHEPAHPAVLSLARRSGRENGAPAEPKNWIDDAAHSDNSRASKDGHLYAAPKDSADEGPAPRRDMPFDDPFGAFWERDKPEDDEADKGL